MPLPFRDSPTRYRWLAAAALIGAPACGTEGRTGGPAGSLAVEWIGSDTGKLSGPAVAEWCDSLRLLEVRAIRGDTGIALVLYPGDSVTRASAAVAGDYPVVPPARGDSSRPSAAIALRWFAETSIRGFRGDSGSVVLEAIAPGSGAGRFSAYLGSATEGSKLTVAGSFEGLNVVPAPAACAGRLPQRPAPPAEPDDPADLTDAE